MPDCRVGLVRAASYDRAVPGVAERRNPVNEGARVARLYALVAWRFLVVISLSVREGIARVLGQHRRYWFVEVPPP
jgi:hypothetical protein